MKVVVTIRIWFVDGAQEIKTFTDSYADVAIMEALGFLSDIAAIERKGIKAVTISVSQ